MPGVNSLGFVNGVATNCFSRLASSAFSHAAALSSIMVVAIAFKIIEEFLSVLQSRLD